MAKIDLQALKDAAKAKAAEAKRDAAERRLRKATPTPQYVQMPEPTGDGEVDSAKDLSELEQGFRRRAADEGRRFAMATDSEFWGAVCFHTSEQRDAFFAALNIADLSIGGRYFDGNAIAERLGIKLPEADPPQKLRKPDPAWVEFT
jgi:hypothetical protein